MEEFQIGNRIYDESNNSTLVRGPLIPHNVFDPIKRHLSPHGHITFDGIMSGGVYRDYSVNPVDLSITKFPSLEDIWEIKSYFDQEDETYHSIIQVSTKSNPQRIWVYTHTLLSYDEEYYARVRDFIIKEHIPQPND